MSLIVLHDLSSKYVTLSYRLPPEMLYCVMSLKNKDYRKNLIPRLTSPS